MKPHSGDIMVYDAVDKQTKSYHILVYSNMGYKPGDIIEHGILHQIPDSLGLNIKYIISIFCLTLLGKLSKIFLFSTLLIF